MNITIRVEITSHSYSFHVTLPASSTVHNLKQAIHEQCQGKPSVEGQRLIAKGRVLRDEEAVNALWAVDETKSVYLAVNPNSWTSIPPNLATRPSPSSTLQGSAFGSSSLRFASQGPHPLAYIHFVHANALRALQRAPLVMNLGTWDLHNAREWSKMIVESYGYEWPTVLDEDFPGELSTVYPTGEGVFYRSQYINGYPYMSLSTKSTAPTPLQERALKILTFTFPLLSLTFQPIFTAFSAAPTSTFPGLLPTSLPAPINPAPVNPRAPAPPALPRAQLPNFPFRALAMPFLMMLLRTVVLLYIFAPARKPVFAALITGWLVWELWVAVRGVLVEERRGVQNNIAAGGQAARNGPRNPANGIPVPIIVPRLNGNRDAPGNHNQFTRGAVDQLARYRLREEEANFDAPNARPPTLSDRLKHALILFFLTIHPEVWNRRRRTLREREARVKREAAERRREPREPGQNEEPANPERVEQANAQPGAQLRRRVPWVEAYIDRVERAEWIEG